MLKSGTLKADCEAAIAKTEAGELGADRFALAKAFFDSGDAETMPCISACAANFTNWMKALLEMQ